MQDLRKNQNIIPHGLEGICGYVTFNHQKVIVANIYRPPSENSNISWFDKMDTLLDNFTIDGYELQRADHLKTKGREETRTQNSELRK